VIINMNQRISAIDALRGIAVFLMMEQHLLLWLWNEPWKGDAMLDSFPVLMTLNGLGGFAAPLFITLAGIGSFLFMKRPGSTGKTLCARGIIIILFGYLLNFLTPSWFTPSAWYVLHLIGFGLAISPLLQKLSTPRLVMSMAIIIVTASILQIALEDPGQINPQQMSDHGIAVWLLRLALAEGHFPIFPWLAFFIAGILIGRWTMEDRINYSILMSAGMITAGTVLSVIGFIGFDTATSGPAAIIFTLLPDFYPARAPITLILLGLSTITVAFIMRDGFSSRFGPSGLLACLGRASLTLLIAHIVVFRELSIRLGFYRKLDTAPALIALISIILFFMLLSFLWRRIDFKYGAEWVMRKISG
jgi:uncharacterized protein